MKKSKEEWKVYKNVFSESSRKNIFKLKSEGHFEELASPISIGKEANIFSARTKDGKMVVVKIYRLENCNFNKMFEYLATDPRYLSIKKNKRQIVFAWTQREYKNLLLAREAVRVPTPITFKKNIVVMEMIGEPAPMLKDAIPEDPENFLRLVVKNFENMKKNEIIHGDLSEFNILNHEEKPVFIDFSQATIKRSPNARDLYERDKKNIKRFFNKIMDEKAIEKVFEEFKKEVQ